MITNPDGSVSETNTANLLLINGREAILPASPAVLPGVMSGAACRMLKRWGYRVKAEAVDMDGLLDADQVLITNALMGCVPLRAIDGRIRPEADDLWMRLNDAIIPDWRRDF